jgi:polar amino acid transport system substrate-binding protein
VVLSKKEININGWESLSDYSIAYERGTKFIEAKEHYFKHKFLVNTTEQALAMVFTDRVNLTVTSVSTATKILNENPEYAQSINILQPPLTYITLHVYLNKNRQEKLANKLPLVLKKMKASGQFQDLLKPAINKVTKTINPTQE